VKFFFLLVPILFVLATSSMSAQQGDTTEYVVQMKNGDSFRGRIVGSTDSTISIRTEFGRVEVPKPLIESFIERNGPYSHRPLHYLMPSGSPNGPGGFLSDYELGFLYGGFGLGYGATITGGMSVVPSVEFRKQLFHVGAKFTIERSSEMDLAIGATYTWFTLDFPYSHVYAVSTFPLGTGRYSVMMMYRIGGREFAPISLQAFGGDTTSFTLVYEGSLGAAIGFDAPAFGRDDMSFFGEIWNNDISKPQNTLGVVGVRVSNNRLSSDFGLAVFSGFNILPVTSFTWRF
jgi:hypothetical protein